MKYLLIALLLSGCSGPAGVQGVEGPQGVQGLQGPAGSSPYIVQFCSAGTTHYPDTFCEIGFCFEGNLYATYSANDGFSSLIPPGYYNSNGINCSCALTVSDACKVS